jgi:hypothetical protein
VNVLEKLGGVAREQEDFGAARAWFSEGLALARQIGFTDMIAGILHAWAELDLLEGDDAAARLHWEEAVDVFRASGNKRLLACALHGQGYVAQHAGDVAGMVTNFGEALALFHELEMPGGIDICLAGFAAVAVKQVRPERAGRLFGGGVCAAARSGGGPRWLAHQMEIERNIARARTQVHEATFAAAWAEGEAMSMEQAIAYAMETPI